MGRRILALITLIGIAAAVVACIGGDSTMSVPTAPGATAPPTVPATAAPVESPPAQPSSTQSSPAEATPEVLSTAPVNADAIVAGQALFTGAGGCGACHAIEGLTHGALGPELNGIAAVAAGRIPGYSAEQYLRESIVDSCAYTVEGTDCNLMLAVMNTIHLTDADEDALVAFLLQQR